MKAPAFDYVKPSSLAQVFSLLETHGDDARIIAGGQSLLATLNMRLSEPQLLLDINAIPGLSGITLHSDCVQIGALTRHCDIEDSALIAEHVPLLAMAAPFVAHRAIRNRGTLGGSIAFADPAAEWPTCAVALDASIVLASRSGERRVKAKDFFQDLYTTAMEPGEIVTACEFPLQPRAMRFAFDELARRRGDYAIVGLAASGQFADGLLRQVRLVFLGTGNIPLRARAAETAIEGKSLNADTFEAARTALATELHPAADLYHSAEAKQHLASVLMRRLLQRLAA
ncbi:xanthine dehydrogenase family protein subunit M [Noviherbaspirillum sp.]|uniref:FAD binding domain-containing protein n=1 Tax=Noviherbaspirillum sp. TaxID=1926288 RepID=UPI0025E81360|nr:xanthine dehydrogenase family protein subunit M [Noviherbaspirillum sp.]